MESMAATRLPMGEFEGLLVVLEVAEVSLVVELEVE